MSKAGTLVDDIGEGVPGAAQQGKNRDQPACGIKPLATQDGVDHEQDRDHFQQNNDEGKDGVCDLNLDLRYAHAEGESQTPSNIRGKHADPGADPDEAYKPWVSIELKKINQEKPLADLADGDQGLDHPGQPDGRYRQGEDRSGTHPEPASTRTPPSKTTTAACGLATTQENSVSTLIRRAR